MIIERHDGHYLISDVGYVHVEIVKRLGYWDEWARAWWVGEDRAGDLRRAFQAALPSLREEVGKLTERLHRVTDTIIFLDGA